MLKAAYLFKKNMFQSAYSLMTTAENEPIQLTTQMPFPGIDLIQLISQAISENIDSNHLMIQAGNHAIRINQ